MLEADDLPSDDDVDLPVEPPTYRPLVLTDAQAEASCERMVKVEEIRWTIQT